MRSTIAQAYALAFRLPALLGPAFEDWPLSDGQAQQLALATDGLLRSLPKRSKESATKTLARVMPWVAFLTTSFFIVYPRALMTGNKLRARRSWVRDGTLGAAPNPGGGPDGPANAGGAGDGTDPPLRTWADYRAARGG